MCHFYVLPRASHEYIQCELIPSVVWRISNKVSSSFWCRMLVLSIYNHTSPHTSVHTPMHPGDIWGVHLYICFICQDEIHPWMSLMPFLLQSLIALSTWIVLFLILLNHSLLLALGLINYGSRLGCFFHLCLWPSRCQHLNCFAASLTTLQPLGSGLNITLNPANKKSLSEFQTTIGVAAHVTFDMEQLILHIRVALVDTTSSLPDPEAEVIPISEVQELLIKIHDILDNAMSKQVGKSACF